MVDGAVPAYLLDREGVSRAKVLSNTVKQKRKEKTGEWEVPIPKVKLVADDEMFKVMRTGSKSCSDEMHFCWGQLYSESSQIREIHSTDGVAHETCQCDSS